MLFTMIDTGSHSETLCFSLSTLLTPPPTPISELELLAFSPSFLSNTHSTLIPYFLYQRSTQVSLWFKKKENLFTNFHCPNDKDHSP